MRILLRGLMVLLLGWHCPFRTFPLYMSHARREARKPTEINKIWIAHGMKEINLYADCKGEVLIQYKIG